MFRTCEVHHILKADSLEFVLPGANIPSPHEISVTAISNRD
jgi:hypothetical protein